MSNRDIALGYQSDEEREVGEQSVHLTDQLEEVQARLTRHYETLAADLEYDARRAQKAEHYALNKLDRLNHNEKIRSRDLRINTQCITRFRQRTHSNLVRLAEVLRAREVERRLAEERKLQVELEIEQAKADAVREEAAKEAAARAASQVVQVNFGQKPVQDDELYDALEVLEGAGIVSHELKEEIDGKRTHFAVTGESVAESAESEGEVEDEGSVGGQGGAEAVQEVADVEGQVR